MDNLSAKLFEDTPTITVNDNLGRPVRVVEFNRTNIGDERSVRISRTEFSATGYTSGASDPRFFLRGLTNQKQQWNLAGQLVRVDSVDAGERLILPDVTGAAYLEWDEKGKRRRYEYDTALHRLVAVHEKVSQDDVSEQVLERWVYGQQEDALFNLNLQVKAHYDLGGCLETQAISLTGQPLSQRRRLLWDYSAQSDWQGGSPNEWNKRLGVQEYHTVWAYNALGQWLTQQDAKDNIQRQEYDCTGRLSASYYQVVGSEETPTLALIEYNANGQVILEKAGNGVETHYQYDKKDWRLIKVTTTRPVKEGRVALLQSLNYSYDRVGNLLSVKDDAQAPRFYKNQRVDAEQAYSYDALYQIIKAVGREKAGNNIQGASLPELLTPLSDSHQLQNYTRYYDYDASGNMLSIQHKGAHDYRRDFVVATHSNQSVAQNPNNTLTPEGIRHRFDTHGNLTQLEGGEALIWGPYDLLRETILSSKQKETYQYSQRGARLRKVLIDENNATQEEVIYLPGLEIRERSDIRNGAVKERLNVVLISGSRGQVRELQWEIGLPSGVTNHQLRYNYSNHIGSHSLELNNHADILSQEEYYPFGGTAIWSAKSDVEAKYKFVRYSGKERDITGLYYYGYRYYMPWMCRWLSPDPAWDIDGLNLYRMVRNNPVTFEDRNGLYTGLEDGAPLRLLFSLNHELDNKLGGFERAKDIGRLGRLRKAVGDRISLYEHEERILLPPNADSEGGHALNRHVPPPGEDALSWASRRYDVLENHKIASAAFFSLGEAERLITEVIKSVNPKSYAQATDKREKLETVSPIKVDYKVYEPRQRPIEQCCDITRIGVSYQAPVRDIRKDLYPEDRFLKRDGLVGKSFTFTHDFNRPVGVGFKSREDRDKWLESGESNNQFVQYATSIEVVITTGVGKKGTKTANNFKLVSAYPITK
ncbi:RHS repeat domain-containing protein [Vibrio owensii]|uniref:RHS repeat domain-containing protein n=1 Tax=Vibrio owensii TaxID=696485 RepID=UPI003DA0C979